MQEVCLKNLEEIKDKTIIIKGKANEQGHLPKFIKEIVEAMKSQNHADIGEEFIVFENQSKKRGHEISCHQRQKVFVQAVWRIV